MVGLQCGKKVNSKCLSLLDLFLPKKKVTVIEQQQELVTIPDALPLELRAKKDQHWNVNTSHA